MRRPLILCLVLLALASGASGCRSPCGEPFWKKPQSLACEGDKPLW